MYKQVVAHLAARAKEASSYAGLATIVLSALGVTVNPTFLSMVLGLVAAVGGFVAFLVPESGAPAPVLTLASQSAAGPMPGASKSGASK